MLNQEIRTYFNITDNAENNLKKYMNKRVRYRADKLSNEFIRKNGTIALTETFIVKESQYDFENKVCLRMYATSFDDTMGRVAYEDDIAVVTCD